MKGKKGKTIEVSLAPKKEYDFEGVSEAELCHLYLNVPGHIPPEEVCNFQMSVGIELGIRAYTRAELAQSEEE